MKITCNRVGLQEALGVIAAAVPSQATTPVALDVLLQGSADGLRLQSTDLTLFAEVSLLELKEVEPGDALIPVTRLVGLVRELESEDIVLERNPEEFSVRVWAGSDDFKIMGHDPEDFPVAPGSTESPPVSMESDMLSEAIRSVSFAASRDVSRQQLQGVAVIMEGRKIHFVASDGKRLAEYSGPAGGELDRRREGIVPTRAVEAIERLLSLHSGSVSLRLDPEAQQIVVSHGQGRVLCRLLEGQMPDYVSMIPREFATTIEGAARDVLIAVRKAAVLTTKENAVVSLEAKEGTLTVRVSSQDVGSGIVPVENVTVAGEDLTASFAVSFLSDGLRALGDRELRLGLQKDRGAAVMHSGRTFRYAFMPVIPHGAE